MRLDLLITNHGKHDDDKLGFAFADDVIQVAADMTGQSARDGRRLANQIADIAAKHFHDIAERENAGIMDKGHDHLLSHLNANASDVDALVSEIVTLGNTSPLKAWFDKPEVLANIREASSKWIRTAQHMHRDWFARHGKVGHGAELKDVPGYDKTHEHVRMWTDLHDAPTPEAHRWAIHNHATLGRAL